MALQVVKFKLGSDPEVIGLSKDGETANDYKARMEVAASSGALKGIPFFDTLADYIAKGTSYTYSTVSSPANAAAAPAAVATARQTPGKINMDTYVEEGGSAEAQPGTPNGLDFIDDMIARYSPVLASSHL